MIPSVVAAEVTGALRDFLATGFGPSNPGLAHVIDDFLAQPENLAKGPYLSIALPFQPAPEGGEPFPEVLSGSPRTATSARRSRGSPPVTGGRRWSPPAPARARRSVFSSPSSTTAGNASGRRGIKAILVDPMNALAADQARRIAQTIDRTPALRGRVTAGVFVGRDNQPQRSAHKTMGRDHVVTDRATLRERPPDILLTNYKMLDYLLVRPFD